MTPEELTTQQRIIALTSRIANTITKQPLGEEAQFVLKKIEKLQDKATEVTEWNFGEDRQANLEASQYVIGDDFRDDENNHLTLFHVLDEKARKQDIEGAYELPVNFSIPAVIVRPELSKFDDPTIRKISLKEQGEVESIFPDGVTFLIINDRAKNGWVLIENYCFNNQGQASRVVTAQLWSSEELIETYPDLLPFATHISFPQGVSLAFPKKMEFPVTHEDIDYVDSLLDGIGTRWILLGASE